MRIAGMCDLALDFSKRYAPVYRVPAEKLRGTGGPPASLINDAAAQQNEGQAAHATMREDEQYLRQLCEDGLIWRYGTTDVSQEIRERLDKEITIIAGKNFSSYFLIVWDFVRYAKDNSG